MKDYIGGKGHDKLFYFNILVPNQHTLLALPVEDRERNLIKYSFALVCTLNMCGYTSVYELNSKKYIKILYLSMIFYFYEGAQMCTSI